MFFIWFWSILILFKTLKIKNFIKKINIYSKKKTIIKIKIKYFIFITSYNSIYPIYIINPLYFYNLINFK